MASSRHSLDSEVYDVVVVGAGLSGLRAAQSLNELDREWLARRGQTKAANGEETTGSTTGLSRARQHPLRVLVVEARTEIGGRVRGLQGLVPWSVELGAEFIHGSTNCSVMPLLECLKARTRVLSFPDRYFFGDTHRMLSPEEADSDPDVRWVHSFFSELRGASEDRLPDTSVLEHMRAKGATAGQLQLADSIYANDYGCSLDKLGLSETVVEAKCWVYGDDYVVSDAPLSGICSMLAQGLEVRCDWPVASIAYLPSVSHAKSEYPLEITRCQSNESIKCRAVVVAVPLPILQSSRITFMPPLPLAKERAISSIRVANAVKVLMSFSHPFWPPDLFDIVCTDSFLPEIWFSGQRSEAEGAEAAEAAGAAEAAEAADAASGSSPASTSPPSPLVCPSSLSSAATAPSSMAGSDGISTQCSRGTCVAVGFAAGSTADRIASLPPHEVVAHSLHQLDAMLGARDCDCSRCDCNGKAIRASAGASSGGCGRSCCGEGFESRRDEENHAGTWVYPVSSKPPCHHESREECRCCSIQQSTLTSGDKGMGNTAEEVEEGGRGRGCAKCRPASFSFVKGYLADWSKDPHILGGYSHPTIGARGAREELSRPVDNMLFFAGEATHHGVNPCLQAALDSGCRAANEAFLALISHARL